MNESPSKPSPEETLRVLECEQILIAADQLARLLDISTRSVWRLLQSGELIEPIRLGGSVRWRLADVKQWVAEGCPPVSRPKKRNRRR